MSAKKTCGRRLPQETIDAIGPMFLDRGEYVLAHQIGVDTRTLMRALLGSPVYATQYDAFLAFAAEVSK